MPWKPRRPGEVPTLGWHVLDRMSELLAAPDRPEYEPFVPTREQAKFVLEWFSVDPVTGARRFRRGCYSRPKGAGKSPFLSAVAIAESLFDVVPAGWDARGQPVGRPWADMRTPWVQICAVSEDQSRNAWLPLLEMLREGPILDAYSGLEPMDTFVNLPKGRIEFVTASAVSREGNRPCHVLMDQVESWLPSNGGVKLAATLRRNLAKTGGTSIEAPNAYIPGEGSVAEDTAEFARRIIEGRARAGGLLYDHREAPPETDLGDRGSLLAGLRYAYGDSTWVDLDRIVAEIWDPATDPQDARRYYLNQVTHAADSWLSQPEWAGCADPAKVLHDGDVVTLGFDGSKSRRRGVADATALVVCRVADGHCELVRAWEQPDGPPGDDWEVPTVEVDAEVADVHKRFKVAGFYADPARWESYIAAWEARHGTRYRVKATQRHPIEWWITGGRSALVAKAVDQVHTAVVGRGMTHDGGSVLTRHVLNARRDARPQGVWLRKDHRDSPRKIDAAWALTLAWRARLDAVAAGVRTGQGNEVRRLR